MNANFKPQLLSGEHRQGMFMTMKIGFSLFTSYNFLFLSVGLGIFSHLLMRWHFMKVMGSQVEAYMKMYELLFMVFKDLCE